MSTSPSHRPPEKSGDDSHSATGASTVPPRARLVSPDLARGLMLLGIAIANITSSWLAPVGDEPDLASAAGGIADGSLYDRLAVVFGALFIHVRGIAMFSTLLGYGFGLLALSLWRRDFPVSGARAVLARRYGFLAAFGAVHMLVLYYGDIMTFYGLTGVILAFLLPLRDRTLLIIAAVLQAIALLFLIPMIMFSSEFDLHGSLDFGSYGEYVAVGGITLIGSLFVFPAEAATVAPVIIVGFVAARKGVLTHPERHLRVLWTAVGVAVAVMVLVGLPWGLSMAGWAPAGWAPRLGSINMIVGMFTGPGLVAAIALGSLPLQRKIDAARAAGDEHRPSFFTSALIALGRRSMTGYVLQSVLCVVFLSSFGLHLVTPGSAASGTAAGIIVWLVTVVIAVVLERFGRPGPLEWLHRRLAYGRAGLPRRWSPPVSGGAPVVDDRGEPGESER